MARITEAQLAKMKPGRVRVVTETAIHYLHAFPPRENPRGIITMVKGEPASKANSRQLVHMKGKVRFIKSEKARGYVYDFAKQVRRLANLIEGPLRVKIDIFYASWQPDLDESVILDCMQGLIYVNDRQVVEKLVRRFVDEHNPRAVIFVEQVVHPHWKEDLCKPSKSK